jgi:hypothetical protein
MKIWLIILGVLIGLLWLIMYGFYMLVVGSAVILRSAGKMKTGNDLAKQMEDTVKNEKEGIPNFFKFYWKLFKRIKDENASE